jgi:hypothetical protein
VLLQLLKSVHLLSLVLLARMLLLLPLMLLLLWLVLFNSTSSPRVSPSASCTSCISCWSYAPRWTPCSVAGAASAPCTICIACYVGHDVPGMAGVVVAMGSVLWPTR